MLIFTTVKQNHVDSQKYKITAKITMIVNMFLRSLVTQGTWPAGLCRWP